MAVYDYDEAALTIDLALSGPQYVGVGGGFDGRDGSDGLVGYFGDDTLVSGVGNDRLVAEYDTDTAHGGSGRGYISLGGDTHQLERGYGGPGRDSGSRGTDRCVGGPGNDTFDLCE